MAYGNHPKLWGDTYFFIIVIVSFPRRWESRLLHMTCRFLLDGRFPIVAEDKPDWATGEKWNLIVIFPAAVTMATERGSTFP